MATISNTSRPGYVWDSTDNVWYPIGTGPHTHAYIPEAIVDAKGDLISATANDTPARLAVGNNGETLVADSSATTGLRWQGDYAAGKNVIINGDFNINQRAFSNTTTTGYGFDRWRCGISGNGTVTFSAQTFALGTAPVAGYESKNYIQIVTTGQTDAGSDAVLQQRIESVRTFANQTVTISFWAKAASGTPGVAVELTQVFGTGGSPSSTVFNNFGKVTLSTSWARYSVTGTVASISGKTLGTDAGSDYLQLRLTVSAGSDFNARTNSLGIQTGTFQFWGVQVEPGNVATAFQTATGTLAGELAACQRYYYRNTPGTTYGAFGLGQCVATDQARIPINLPVTMRTNVATLDYANVGATNNTDAVVTAPTTLTISYSGSNVVLLSFAATGAFAGAGNSTVFRANNSTTAYIAFSAEL